MDPPTNNTYWKEHPNMDFENINFYIWEKTSIFYIWEKTWILHFREKAQREEEERMISADRIKSGRAATAHWRIGPLGRSAKTARTRQQNNNEVKSKENRVRVKIDDLNKVAN